VPGNDPGEGLFFTSDAPLDLGGVVEHVRGQDYVLMGESHGSACDHEAQALFIQALCRSGFRPVLGLEMVGRNHQNVLDLFHARKMSVPELEKALAWESTWGHDFTLYQPVFAVARRFDLQLVALNMPLGASSRAGVALQAPAKVIPGPVGQKQALRRQFEMHEAMRAFGDKGMSLEDFLQAQFLKDSKMAEAAHKARMDHPGRIVLVLAGSGHLEGGWGIESRLRDIDPRASILRVLPVRNFETINRGVDVQDGLFYYCPLEHRTPLGLTLRETTYGIRVISVARDSRAWRAGFRKDDVILSIGGIKAENLQVLHVQGVRAAEEGRVLEFEILRKTTRLYLQVPLNSGSGPQGK
jgi:uncharacterized iron-regulated protein